MTNRQPQLTPVGGLLLLLAATSLAIPVKRDAAEPAGECASRCTGATNKYNYASGKSYTYKFESTTDIKVPDQNENQQVMQNADFTIAVNGPCEFSLKVDKISVKGASVPSTFEADVTKNPLRFSFDDGQIGEICPKDDADETWVLNIKRAILSSLQNAFDEADDEVLEVREWSFKKTDVNGRCKTTYTKEGKKYTRNKQLGSCRGHHGLHGSIRATAYQSKANLNSSPLGDREQSCEHTVDNGQLKEAKCTETHRFTAFSDQDKGLVQSSTTVTITLQGEKAGADASLFPSTTNKHSLEFDHREMLTQIAASAKEEAQTLLASLCEGGDAVQKQTASEFVDLVRAMRKMDEATIETVMSEAAKHACSRQQTLVLDALPMCGTEQCVAVMVKQLKTSKSLTESAKHTWFMSMAFVPVVNENMLNSVIELVDTLGGKELLGIGSLVHTYCRNHADCGADERVIGLVNKLIAKLPAGCKVDDKDIEKTVVVLKSIGNIGNVYSAIDKLNECAVNKQNAGAVRVAAIQSLRRMPCNDDKKNALMAIYKDKSDDVEARITAFLTVIRCVDRNVVRQVNKALKVETVNQVGSFVWSYLHAKRHSTNPADGALSSLLQQEHISRRFNRDPNHYSRFYEFGEYSAAADAGFSGESITIFSPGSYMPRSQTFNVTLNLFGHSVNLFELGARLEGADHLMDSLFGPEGLYSSPNNYHFNKDKKNKSTGRALEIQNQQRERKSYATSQRMSTEFSLKMFGDELAYFGEMHDSTLEDLEKSTGRNWIKYLSELRQIQLAKNFIFIDTTKTIPTLSGLPLRMSVTGASSVNVELGGKADLTKLLSKPYEAELLAIIKPSATIEIASTLAIQTSHFLTGYTQKARLHSSLASETEISIEGGKVFRTLLKVPQTRQDLFHIDLQRYKTVGSQQTPINQVPLPAGVEGGNYCSGDVMARVFGQKMCVQMRSNDADVPVYTAGVYMEKTDPKLESYEFKIEIGEDFKPKAFSLDTPGSEVDREVRVDLKLEGETKEVNLRTPGKELKFEGKLGGKNDDGSQSGELILTVDKTDKYEMNAKYTPKMEGSTRSLELEADYQGPDGGKPITVVGHVKNDRSSLVPELRVKIEGLDEKPYEYSAKGKLDKWTSKAKVITAETLVATPESEYKMNLLFDQSADKCNMLAEVDGKRGGTADRFKWEMKSDTTKAGGKTTVNRKVTLDKSFHAASNFEMNTVDVSEKSKTERTCTMKYGEGLAKEGTMTMVTEQANPTEMKMYAAAKMPDFGVDHKIHLSYDVQLPNKFELSAKVDAPQATNDVDFVVKFTQKHQPKMELTADMKLNAARKMHLHKHIKQKSANEYVSKTIIQWDEDRMAVLNADVLVKPIDGAGNYEYKVDAKAEAVGTKFNFVKHAKYADNKYVYNAQLKREGQSLYDVDVESGRAGTKCDWDATFRSDYLSGADYQITGEADDTNDQTAIKSTLKAAGKDYAELEFINPKPGSSGGDPHCKTLIAWDLDTKRKELLGEYNLKTTGSKRQHEFTVSSTLAADKYAWTAVAEKDDATDKYGMENKFQKNDKTLVHVNWDVEVHMKESSINVVFKTHEPLTKRHHSATLNYLSGRPESPSNLFAEYKCHLTNRRAYLEVNTKSDPADEVTANVGAGDALFHNKITYGARSMKGESTLQWAKGRAITRKFDAQYEMNQPYKYVDTITTPFDTLKNFESSLEVDVAQKKGSWGFKWDDKEMDVDVAMPTDELTIKLTPPSKKALTVKITNADKTVDGAAVQEQGVSLKWAESNQVLLRSIRTTRNPNDYEGSFFWEAKVDGVADLKTRADLNVDGDNIKSLLMYKNREDVYQVNADVNTATNEGTVKVQTPNQELQTAKLQVESMGDGEYKLSTERNGAASAIVAGRLQRTADLSVAKIKVTGVDAPFEIDYRNGGGIDMQLIVTLDPEGAAQPYGFAVAPHTATVGSEKQTGVEARVVHPKRQPKFRAYKVTSGEDWRATDAVVEFNPNSAQPDSVWTSLKLHKDPKDGKSQFAELTDSRLAHPLSIRVSHPNTQRGIPTDVELRLKYSDLASKDVVSSFGFSKKEAWLLVQHDDSVIGIGNPNEVGLSVEYKKDGEMKKIGVMCRGDQQWGSLELTSPQAKGQLEFERVLVKDQVEYRVLWYEGGAQKPNWVVAVMPAPQRMQWVVELRKAAAGDVVLHASDKLVTADTWVSSIWHMEGKKRVDDIRAKLWLDGDELLKFKLFVRPNSWGKVISTITDFGKSDMLDALKASEADNSMYDMMSSQLSAYNNLQTQIADYVKPMGDYWTTESKQMGEDFGTPALFESVEELSGVIGEIYAIRMDLLELTLKDMADSAAPTFQGVLTEMSEMFDSLRDVAQAVLEPVGDVYQALAELLQVLGAKLNQWKSDFDKFMDENDFLKELADFLRDLDKQVKGWLKAADFDNMSKTVSEYVAGTGVGPSVNAYRRYMNMALEFSAVRGSYAALQPMIDEIATVDLRDLVDRLFNYLRSVVDGQSATKYLPRVTVYNPSKGKFEIELPLPYKAETLKQLITKMEPQRFQNQFKDTAASLSEVFSSTGAISDDLWNRKGLYNAPIKTDGSFYETHNNVAFILNDGDRVDIVTFDGHSYLVDRRCELLLANDFVNGNFELFGEFAQAASGNLEQTLRLEFRDWSIKIHSDGKLTVNGEAKELPYSQVNLFDDTVIVSVTRQANAIQLKTFDGIQVSFDTYYGMTTVVLSRNYHGQSSGLLGSNDNEFANDLALPNGDTNEDLAAFFDSYKTSPSCTVKQPATAGGSEQCETYFKMRDSPLRTCFRRVPPRAFFDTCTDDNKCNVVASYISACAIVGVELQVPDDCLTCTTPAMRLKRHTYRSKLHGDVKGPTLAGGETKQVTVAATSAKKSADIVFVVSEATGHDYVKAKVEEFAKKLTEKVKSGAGSVKDVHYGLVGFGGSEVHAPPHFHTGENSVRLCKKKLKKAVADLKIYDSGVLDDAPAADALEAVLFAAESFPWQDVAAKSIVLFKATEECGPNVDYYDVQTELLNRGIQLSVLTEERIQINQPHAGELMGFDASSMFTSEGNNDELRESLIGPHDACTVLAQETAGTVWTTADRESAVFSVPAERIGSSVSAKLASDVCYECECDGVQLTPQTVCYPCEVPLPVSLSDKAFFNVPYIQLRNTLRKASKGLGLDEV